MNIKNPRLRGAPRQGAATVEFALCASIIFLMFLSMIEITRFYIVRHSMDEAVYMGARVGIVPGASVADVEAAVEDRLDAAGIIGPTITISPSAIDETTQVVTVQASVDYTANSWALPDLFYDATVDAEITLDHENVAFE